MRFEQVHAWLRAAVRGDEGFTLSWSSEESDFVRFSKSRVRQAGAVAQSAARVELFTGSRHVRATVTLGAADDAQRVERAVAQLRAQLDDAPEDPYFLLPPPDAPTSRIEPAALPSAADGVSLLLRGDEDRVGLWSSGTMHRGFASSLGHDRWYKTGNFHVDWSVVHPSGRAVKSSHAGRHWDPAALRAKDDDALARAERLAQEPVRLAPGKYRAWLCPAAVDEILQILAWESFGEQGLRTRSTAWLRLQDGAASLSPMVTLREDLALGLAAPFSADGFARPASVTLVADGGLRGSLVSPRSAKEFGVETNGAEAGEQPTSLSLSPGSLPTADALALVGDGIWVSNLWYLNFSDRAGGRITGMTRFACFAVENGRLGAPIAPARFDDTVYALLGDALEGVSREAELMPTGDTYFERKLAGSSTPALLLRELHVVS